MPEMRIRPRHCDTPVTARRPRVRRAAATVGALAATALLAACGSSGGSSNSGSSSGGSASASSSASASGGKGTVMVGKVNGYGSVLVTAADQPIYILSTDPSGSSKCSGSCAKTWKPVTVSGAPKAGSGASSSLLSSFKRSDGTTQVLYDKHALYTHAGSAASAAGTASDGGVWYLINAKGTVVKSTTQGGY
jgi:predicted lipoprotein with Yx(FWY)xxD motif